ncbi:hypothetical protein KAW65_07635 [candidate division WOR-3 bacterium]|nr:hypothetical protein [candidate division WOR-3 bacterium]
MAELENIFVEKYAEVATTLMKGDRTVQEEEVMRSIKPTVVIGLGGSGTKSVDRIKGAIKKYYKGIGENIVDMIQFLTIDTLSWENTKSEEKEFMVGRNIEIGEYVEIGGFNPLRYLGGKYKISDDLRRWWDDRYIPPNRDIEVGAKRIRQLGRLALYRSREEVEEKLRTAITNVLALNKDAVRSGTLPPLKEKERRVNVYLISGTCGGTGSGMLLDTAYLIHRIAGPETNIRVALILPTVFIRIWRHRSREVADAFEANAYALFKEIQYFQAPETGKELFDYCMNANERKKRGEKGEDTGWTPFERVYLIDTDIGDKQIREPEHLYMIAADYIFHQIVTPLGKSIETAVTDVDDVLLATTSGRPTCFSSVGVSYLLYPSRTLGRCLSAYLAGEIIGKGFCGTPPKYIEEGEKVEKEDESKISTPSKEAEQFLAQEEVSQFFNSVRIDNRLLEGYERYIEALHDALSIMRSGRARGYAVAMREAEETGEAQEIKGKNLVNRNYEEFKREAEGKVVEYLKNEAMKCSGTGGLSYARGVMTKIKEIVDKSAKANIPHPSADADTKEREAADRVERLERRTYVFHRERAIEREVNSLVSTIRDETESTIREYAAGDIPGEEGKKIIINRAGHLTEVVGLIDDAINRLGLIESKLLMDLKGKLDKEKGEFTLEKDEVSVPVTVQLAPPGLSRDTAEKIAKGYYENLNLNIYALMQELSGKAENSFWNIGSKDSSEAEDALQEFTQHLAELSTEKSGDITLKKSITDIIKEHWKTEEQKTKFKNDIARNLRILADPCWSIDTKDIPDNENHLTNTYSAIARPPDFPDKEYLSEELKKNPLDGENRKLVVLNSQHGAPLFAVHKIRAMKGMYTLCINDKGEGRGHKFNDGPPHPFRKWDTEDALPSLEPVTGAETTYFALGLFIDWLITEKKEEKILSLIDEKNPRGCVYKKGANYFFLVSYEEIEGKLVKVKTKTLTKVGRVAGARAFDQVVDAKKVVEFFINKTVDILGAESTRLFVEEYCRWLVSEYPDVRVDKPKRKELILQVEEELKALREYRKRELEER